MEIRGLTPEQIERAVERASEKYSDNIVLVERWTKDYTTVLFEDVSGPRTPNRYRIQLKVRSARRPGARVAQRADYSTGKRKRIGSACWHAHRDVFRAMFEENENAVIKTALADYHGVEDFEEKFPETAYGMGMAGAAPIADIGDACNCDEGEFPEYAVEGLTEAQYEMRLDYWGDSAECCVKAPKRGKAIINSANAGVSANG